MMKLILRHSLSKLKITSKLQVTYITNHSQSNRAGILRDKSHRRRIFHIKSYPARNDSKKNYSVFLAVSQKEKVKSTQ